MSFFVILEHFYKPKNITLQEITIRLRFHVPTFLIISFYYLNNNLVNRKVDKIKERLERLLIPYLFYPIIIYIIYKFLYIFFHFEELRKSLYQLIIQFIVGRLICPVLWFQFNLILISVLFYIIAFTFKSNYLTFLQILGILSYLLQFSNINFNYFIKYTEYIGFSVGYFAETLPIAVTVLSISNLDIINISKKSAF
jgi:fucose 4-O-acetylase-like acetyltransferase